jgi:hypothetical protein
MGSIFAGRHETERHEQQSSDTSQPAKRLRVSFAQQSVGAMQRGDVQNLILDTATFAPM